MTPTSAALRQAADLLDEADGLGGSARVERQRHALAIVTRATVALRLSVGVPLEEPIVELEGQADPG